MTERQIIRRDILLYRGRMLEAIRARKWTLADMAHHMLEKKKRRLLEIDGGAA